MLKTATNTLLLYILTFVLAIVCAALTWGVFNILSNTSVTPNSNTSLQLPQDMKNQTSLTIKTIVNQIISQNLFGKTEQPKAALLTPIVPVKSVKRTALNLKLTGLIKGVNSVAVIVYKGKQNAYAEGDYIVKSSHLTVRLNNVMHTHVTIINNGNQERLDLPKINSKSAIQLGITTNNKILSVDLNTAAIKALIGADLKKTITTNPLSLSKFMQLSPSIENGNLKGYKVSAGTDKRLLETIGVLSGDVITLVNNKPAGSLTTSSLYQLLQVKDTLRVTIDRNGSLITMDIKL
jgi:general secretion pathway protein C